MASNHNPFATWSAGNGYSSNNIWNQDSAPPPSIVGALPYPHSPSYPLPPDELITYTFTSFNPTILNCTVLGPHNRPYFQVVTDASMPGYTLWKDGERKNIALVEWQNTPLLEARGILTKQQITNWLRLAPDRSHRTLEFRGNRYIWAPYSSHICLYAAGTATPKTLAKVSKSFNIISLEMTPEAIQLGLLEICVIVTVLLQCGRNID
ncbi:hypothetical protein PILCRDRAFT_64756 [Piloderma croceum F 1598]|uniref:Uncharacterized protein n=1 Tax=Piloderma croceum (strain F 1598) TaxID=765440 RepID=A0A0C3G4G0_PILCF|nr:hypothetical protein PILCRDRAFT_64756 [Piloderma croceum F 1598]